MTLLNAQVICVTVKETIPNSLPEIECVLCVVKEDVRLYRFIYQNRVLSKLTRLILRDHISQDSQPVNWLFERERRCKFNDVTEAARFPNHNSFFICQLQTACNLLPWGRSKITLTLSLYLLFLLPGASFRRNSAKKGDYGPEPLALTSLVKEYLYVVDKAWTRKLRLYSEIKQLMMSVEYVLKQ